jgi:hypothetical protein
MDNTSTRHWPAPKETGTVPMKRVTVVLTDQVIRRPDHPVYTFTFSPFQLAPSDLPSKE